MPSPLESSGERPESLNDGSLRQFAGYNLRRAYLAIHDDLTRQLAALELRTITFSALCMIADNPDIIQSRLAEALSMERPNLVVVIDELEQRGFITRTRLASDRRAYALRVTLSGRRLCGKALKTIAAHEDRLLAVLDAAERRTLVTLLNRIEG